jgi:hypothetical protein
MGTNFFMIQLRGEGESYHEISVFVVLHGFADSSDFLTSLRAPILL